MKVHDVLRGNMGKIVADLDVSSAKKVVEAKRGEMVNIGADKIKIIMVLYIGDA